MEGDGAKEQEVFPELELRGERDGRGPKEPPSESDLEPPCKTKGNEEEVREGESESVSEESEVRRLQMQVRMKQMMLQKLVLHEPEETLDFDSIDFNKLIVEASGERSKKKSRQVHQKASSLSDTDLLSQRLHNWAKELYPRIRNEHLKELKYLDLTHKLDAHTVLQAMRWTRPVPRKNPRGGDNSVLEYWSRQLRNWKREFQIYKEQFHNKYPHLKYGVDDTMLCTKVQYGEEAFQEFLDFTTVRNGVLCSLAIRLNEELPETTCDLALEGLSEYIITCFK